MSSLLHQWVIFLILWLWVPQRKSQGILARLSLLSFQEIQCIGRERQTYFASVLAYRYTLSLRAGSVLLCLERTQAGRLGELLLIVDVWAMSTQKKRDGGHPCWRYNTHKDTSVYIQRKAWPVSRSCLGGPWKRNDQKSYQAGLRVWG